MKSKLDLLSNNEVQLFTFRQEVVTCTTYTFFCFRFPCPSFYLLFNPLKNGIK